MFKVTTLLTEVDRHCPMVTIQEKKSLLLIHKVFSFVFLFFLSFHISAQQSNFSGNLANKQLIQSQVPSTVTSPLNGVQIVQPNDRFQTIGQAKSLVSPLAVASPNSQTSARQSSLELESKDKTSNMSKRQNIANTSSNNRVRPNLELPPSPTSDDTDRLSGNGTSNNKN